jgi:V8-like Glu-specific endopeptidase
MSCPTAPRRDRPATTASVLTLLVSAFLVASGAVVHGVELSAQRDGVVEEVSFRTPDFGEKAVAGNVRWQAEVQKIGAQYVRLRFAGVAGAAGTGAVLTLRDRGGRLVREYSEADLAARDTFWSAIVPGDYALVTLLAPEPPVGFGLTIDQLAYQAFAGAALSTVGEDEKESIAAYAGDPLISGLARPVAKLLFMQNGAPHTCTGFLIGSGQLMTNHHCVSTPEVCETTLAIFGYQHDSSGLLHFGEQFECEKVDQSSNFELDFAILDIKGNPSTLWGTLDLVAGDPDAGGPLFVVQHPAGQPKQISKVNCGADVIPVDGRAPETDFTHSCDTVGGSSGSPVFNSAGQLVGLHHYGFGEGGEWTENRAIRMKRIVDHLGE